MCPSSIPIEPNLFPLLDPRKIAPTILLDVPEDSLIMKEEIFGPLLPIVTVKVEKIEDSFEVIKSKPKPLDAYLFSDDEQMKKDFVQNVYAGGMLVKFSFDAFSHKKGVLYRSFNGDATTRSHSFFMVKMYGLGMEFWNPRVIMGMAQEIGLLIQIDKAMREKAFCYYARLLVEVDLSAKDDLGIQECHGKQQSPKEENSAIASSKDSTEQFDHREGQQLVIE
ncbi:hypothetical protein QYF36_012659 [Acer negundo]|nr:hypothetical protein QYF36_012659 [Acer negundo]